MARYINPVPQYQDTSGALLGGGFLYFYESGTTTEKNTYADANLTIENTWPLEINADGTVPNTFFNGTAKVILTDSEGVQLWERDPVGDVNVNESIATWAATVTYQINSIVEASDGNFYISLQDDNLGNDPVSSPEFWSELIFIHVWNTNETYATGDVVQGSNGFLYRSLTDDNTGNDPISDDVNWGSVAANPTDLSLSDLTDVDTTGVTDGNILVYNDTDSEWQPQERDLATERNLIINGDFQWWQRGTSFTDIDEEYSADRWYIGNGSGGGVVVDVSQQSHTEGEQLDGYSPQYYLELDVTTIPTTNGSYIEQRIENVRTVQDGDITISLTARVASGTIEVIPSVRQDFGVGGSTEVETSGTAWTITDEFTTFTQTITVPSVAGQTIGVRSYIAVVFTLPINTLLTFDVALVKAERGDEATPFQLQGVNIGDELSLCQRYFFELFELGVASATNSRFANNIVFPTSMISVPTLTFTHDTGTGATFGQGDEKSCRQVTDSSINAQGTLTGDSEL